MHVIRRVTLPLLCGLPFISHLHAADAPTTRLEISLKKPRDKATVETNEARVVVSVASESGIGQAEIKLAQGEWPKSLVLNLALKGLEGFYAENGALRVQTSLKQEKPEVSIRTPEGAWQETRAEDRHRVQIRQSGERIEIELPAVLLDKKATTIRVQWVDFYR